jgi:hypothetical protein
MSHHYYSKKHTAKQSQQSHQLNEQETVLTKEMMDLAEQQARQQKQYCQQQRQAKMHNALSPGLVSITTHNDDVDDYHLMMDDTMKGKETRQGPPAKAASPSSPREKLQHGIACVQEHLTTSWHAIQTTTTTTSRKVSEVVVQQLQKRKRGSNGESPYVAHHHHGSAMKVLPPSLQKVVEKLQSSWQHIKTTTTTHTSSSTTDIDDSNSSSNSSTMVMDPLQPQHQPTPSSSYRLQEDHQSINHDNTFVPPQQLKVNE